METTVPALLPYFWKAMSCIVAFSGKRFLNCGERKAITTYNAVYGSE